MSDAKLERRMKDLEKEVATLRSKIDELSGSKPWWERIAGSFHGDPIYQKAMQLGSEIRRGKPSKRSGGADA
jgi:hypothetical protein